MDRNCERMKLLKNLFNCLRGFVILVLIITILILSLNTVDILASNVVFLKILILISESGLIFVFIINLIIYIHFSFKKYPKDILIEKRYHEIPAEFKDKVTVMIPAYNEEYSIKQAIKNCLKFVNNVLVIDDGSQDDTVKIAKDAGANVVHHVKNLGLARVMKTGIKWCLNNEVEIIVNFDADLQYDAADIPSLVMPVILHKYDLMIGNRFEGRIEQMPMQKQLGNKIFSRLIANFTDTHISDAQSGFRAFSASFARSIKIREGFTYTQQMIIEASERNYRIGEIPIKFAKRNHGASRLMHGALDFAYGAWKLIIRVYLEYRPLTVFSIPAYFLFNIGSISLLEALSHFMIHYNIGLLFFIVSMISYSTAAIIFMIGLYAFSQKNDH